MSDRIEVRRLRSCQEVLDNWDLFSRGLAYFNSITVEHKRRSPQEYMLVLCEALSAGDNRGHIAIYVEGNRPFGFTITIACAGFDPKAVIIYAAYTDKTIQGASRFGLQHVEKWAKSCGYNEVQTFTPNFSGKTFSMFEKRFGFRRWLVCFTKQIK